MLSRAVSPKYTAGLSHGSTCCGSTRITEKAGRGRLLGEIENIAAGEGCSLIHPDTFDFQAKDFYIKPGYEVFGILDGCPEGHCRYYLKKRRNV